MADLRSGAQALPQVPRVAMSAEAVATDINRQGTAIGNTQVAQNRSLPPEEWTGAAADAASSEIQKLGEKTVALSEAFSPASTALNTWADAVNNAISDVTGLQSEWDTAVQDYNKTIEEADAAYKAHDPGVLQALWWGGDRDMYQDSNGVQRSRSQERNKAYEDASGVLTTAQDNIRERYVTRLNILDDAAQTAANSINSARQGIVSDEVGSQGRDAIGANLFGSDTPILSGAEQWAHAQKIAQEMADDLTKEPLTAADVDAFNNKYGKYLQNPFYATALAQHLSIDDIIKAAIAALGTGYDKNGMLVSNAYEEFNRNLGTLMVLSTGGSNLSEANIDNQRAFDLVSDALVGKDKANVREIFQSKLDDLKAYGRTEYKRPSLTGGMSRVLYGYDIFGQLAGAAAYENDSLALGPEFYAGYEGRGDSVFTDMVNWDHEINNHDYARNMEMTPRDYMLCGGEKGKGGRPDGFFDALQSVFALSDTPDNLENLSEEDQSLFRQHEDVRLEALRGALANDTSFGVPEENSKPMSMVRYLTAYRGSADSGGSAFFDGGDVFGKTIFDATTPASSMFPPLAEDYAEGEESLAFKKANRAYEAWKTDAENRASIVGNLIAGYQEGLDRRTIPFDSVSGEDAFGKSNSSLRSWMGSILANNAGDLAQNLATPPGTSENGPDTWVGEPTDGHVPMKLSGALVQKVMGEGGLLQDLAFDQSEVKDAHDPNNPLDDEYVNGRMPALRALQLASLTGYQDDLAEALKVPDIKDQRTKAVLDVENHWTTLFSKSFDADVNHQVAIGKSQDDLNKNMRSIFDFVSDQAASAAAAGAAAGTGPVGGAVLKAALKSASGAAEDLFLPVDNAKKAEDGRSTAQVTAQELLQQSMGRAMYESHNWTENGVDISGDPRQLRRKFPFLLNSDGTLKDWTELSFTEQNTMRDYFGTTSDFSLAYNHQLLLHNSQS